MSEDILKGLRRKFGRKVSRLLSVDRRAPGGDHKANIIFGSHLSFVSFYTNQRGEAAP
jgi:hypothetical protein